MSADRKVLLVEDEVLVAALAVDALEELGYQAIEATTPKAALALANGDTRFSFAVIDIGLPDGRGDALALELRSCAPTSRSSSRPVTTARILTKRCASSRAPRC